MDALPRLLLRKIILNIINSDRYTESLLNFAMAGDIPLPMIKYIVNNGVVAQYVADRNELSFHSTFGNLKELRGNTKAYTLWLTSLIISPKNNLCWKKQNYKTLMSYEFPSLEHIAFIGKSQDSLDPQAILPLLKQYPKLIDLEIQGNMIKSTIPKTTCPSIKRLQLYWQSNKGGIEKTDLEWVKRFLKVFPNIEQLEITVENSFESDQPDLKSLHSVIKKVNFGVPTIITVIDGCYIEENSEYHKEIEPFLVSYRNTTHGWLVYGYERKNMTFIHQLSKPDHPRPQIDALWRKLIRAAFSRFTKHELPEKHECLFDVLDKRVIRRATPLAYLREGYFF